MTRRDKIAVALLKPINPSVIIILGLYTVLWGLWIASPFWDVFGTAQLFSGMRELCPSELVWGGIAVASGLVICRGAIKPSFVNLTIGSGVAFFFWFIIALLYFIGDWMNTGGITSLTFAIYSGLVWLNINVNKDCFTHVID